jgi:glycosidase
MTFLKPLTAAISVSIMASCSTLPMFQSEPKAELHVESPDWSEQIIYFVMPDRFNDGDPSNNDQGAGEYDPTDHRRYSGGDIKGIEQQLDYIQGLGATAIWSTPLVANQWYDDYVDYGGYHGYWARDFKSVDEHYGTLEDIKSLTKSLHGRGMYFVQDIVLNHTGNYFNYIDNKYNVDNVCEHFELNDNNPPTAAPTQSPLDKNDACNPDHRDAAIYHFTPVIRNYDSDHEREFFQLSDLDDLNTENPVVQDLIKDSYSFWIRETGVDGFRVDTAKYVSHDFINNFFHANDGVNEQAKTLGKEDFFSFGEIWDYSAPFDDTGDIKIKSYLGTDDAPEMSSVINFPLQGTMRNVFATGAPTSELAYRLESQEKIYPDTSRLVNFIDNHDMDRFIKAGSPAALRQALTSLMTLPGVPVIYQGTESMFTGQRDSMFANGYGSDGIDHFTQKGEQYSFIAALSELRKTYKSLTKGELNVVAQNENRAGIFAYTRSYKKENLLVLFNTASHDLLSTGIDLGLPAGLSMPVLFGTHNLADAYTIDKNGKLSVALPANSALVLDISGKPSKSTLSRGFASFGFLASKPLTADQIIKGTISSPDITELKLVIDGNLDKALDIAISENGKTFKATLPIEYFPVGETDHVYAIYSPELETATSEQSFKTFVEISAEETISQMMDPEGDDTGAGYPLDTSFADRQMDILNVTVARSDLYLDVIIQPKATTVYWSPTNKFDHVRYHLMFDLPNFDYNETVMPFVQADMPAGTSWDLMAAVDGWSNAVYWAKDAGLEAYGTSASPAPAIKVDSKTGEIKLRFDASLFGKTKEIAGAKLYITTWDYDGVGGLYRAISPEGGQYTMTGEDPSAPLIMDDLLMTIE